LKRLNLQVGHIAGRVVGIADAGVQAGDAGQAAEAGVGQALGIDEAGLQRQARHRRLAKAADAHRRVGVAATHGDGGQAVGWLGQAQATAQRGGAGDCDTGEMK